MNILSNKSADKKPFIFNQWKRKGYSVFASLHKIIKITTLNLAYSIVLLPIPVLSQTDTSNIRNHDLDEVIVSAQKSPVVYSRLSRIVTTVDNEEIAIMPVSRINDVLEIFSGIDIRQRGAFGIQADISIRGGSFDQNLILLNGVNISDPQTGHHSLNLPIDLHAVERIEVLEGSGSRVFGANAFSGAINFITNESKQNYTKANITVGDFGLFHSNLSSAYRIKNTRQFVSVSQSMSNGYTRNTDFNQYNLFYQLNHEADYGKMHFQTGYTNKQFGANSFYTPEYPNQFEQVKTTFASLGFETGNKLKINPVIYFRRHQDRFELFRDEPASWYTGHNYHLTDVYGAKIDARISTKLGISSFSTEIRSENIVSNVLGEPMNDTLNAIGEEEGFYTKKYSRTLSNYAIEHSFSFSNFSVNAGLLASWVTGNRSAFNLYPGMDISFALTKQLRWYASINKSLRLPTFTDLFYSGPNNTGNPYLKPEEAWSYETGLKYSHPYIISDYQFFYRDAKDLIAWVKPLGSNLSDKWETQNLTEGSTLGLSTNQRILFHQNKRNKIIKYVDIKYTYLYQKVHSDNYKTNYSLNYLKHHLIIQSAHQILQSLTLSWSARFQDRAGRFPYYDQTVRAYTREKEYTPVWLFDTRLNYKLKWSDIYVEISNLFNHPYDDISNIPMPGRWFKIGIKTTLNY
ncbi:MAG TPA: TonB-dependent receptor [Bacteroidales bacterium]|nr:TonB-dependent receptor [Bacteroidales bacterium]